MKESIFQDKSFIVMIDGIKGLDNYIFNEIMK